MALAGASRTFCGVAGRGLVRPALDMGYSGMRFGVQPACHSFISASKISATFFSSYSSGSGIHGKSYGISLNHGRPPVTSLAEPPKRTRPGSLPSPMAVEFLAPQKMLSFAINYILSFRFYFMFMARTTFQAVRPLLAFSVFGEVMKMVLATMSSALFSFCFSFVLAFEVLYFFLQCYISYTFLTMFFTVMF